jgi:hypothetical protein
MARTPDTKVLLVRSFKRGDPFGAQWTGWRNHPRNCGHRGHYRAASHLVGSLRDDHADADGPTREVPRRPVRRRRATGTAHQSQTVIGTSPFAHRPTRPGDLTACRQS